MEFSEKLKKLRAEKGISQAALAAEIHISRSAVAKWENGLGLPGNDSLQLLADYFGVSPSDLLPDKSNAETIISKNKTIVQQEKLITVLLLGIGLGLFIFLYLFVPSSRQSMELLGLGAILTILGIFNMKGNIASIHWYNRRKVTKENQKAYCLVMGLGTLIIGVCLIVSGIVQAFIGIEPSAVIMVIGILIGLALMLYGQIKYNKGIF